MSKKRKFILGFVLGFVLFLYVCYCMHHSVLRYGFVTTSLEGPWLELKYYTLLFVTIILGAVGGLVLWIVDFILLFLPKIDLFIIWFCTITTLLSLGFLLPSVIRYFKYKECTFIDTALITFGYVIWCTVGYISMNQFLITLKYTFFN